MNWAIVYLWKRILYNNNYGPGVVSALISSATAVWQVKQGNNEMRNDLTKKVDALDTNVQRLQKIALRSALILMKAMTGGSTMMKSWFPQR